MKKILCFILLVFMSITMTSCTHLEDSNGENDYSVVSITDEDILSFGHSYISVGSFTLRKKTGDLIEGTFKVQKLSGILQIDEFKYNSQYFTFSYDFTCTKGNAMLAIVSNGEIVKKIEANTNSSFKLNNNKKYYTTYLVGESANVQLNYKINSSNW